MLMMFRSSLYKPRLGLGFFFLHGSSYLWLLIPAFLLIPDGMYGPGECFVFFQLLPPCFIYSAQPDYDGSAGGCVTFFSFLIASTEMKMLCAGCNLSIRRFEPFKSMDQICLILLRF